MDYLKLLKKQAVPVAALLLGWASWVDAAQPYPPLGILGAESGVSGTGPAYAVLVSPAGQATTLTTNITAGFVNSVAINTFAQGLIGGQNANNAYVAFISPSGAVTPISISGATAINSVAINDYSQGIIGGTNFAGSQPYAALISPSGAVAPIATGITISGDIKTVAINDASVGIIGGNNVGAAFAALISPAGTASNISLSVPNGVINSVAINSSSEGIIGGQNVAAAYAAIVSSGSATPITGLPSTGSINSVAINNFSEGIIGGTNGTAAYAAVVSSGAATNITLGVPNGVINSVAINDYSYGIIGGQIQPGTSGPAYAALISPSGVATPLTLGLPSGVINSVAINEFSQGLIAGQDLSTKTAYAALVSPGGLVIPIATGLSPGIIYSAAILSQIPTGKLGGNNLIFANYINRHAPQDAFYFVPAFFDGSLESALESAAPTRNAISVYTANNNLFYFTTGLSVHLRNRSYKQKRREAIASRTQDWKREDGLLASMRIYKQPSYCAEKSCIEECSYAFWVEAIGAWAHQKAQHQTPAFDPSSGGAILAFDGKVCENTRVGIGATYLYTHVDEKQGAGHSNIQQEDLFIYGSWEYHKFYFDAAVLGGLYQTEQVRNIKMKGFKFKSTSHPKGWQLLPHIELGLNFMRQMHNSGVELRLNPLVMLDWANTSQYSYKEKGKGPFNAGQKSHHSSILRTEASMRFYETLSYDNWNLVFLEKAGYVNLSPHHAGTVHAFLIGSPGSFTVETLTSTQNLGVGQFMISFAPYKTIYPTCSVFYQAEFGGKFLSQELALDLTWNF